MDVEEVCRVGIRAVDMATKAIRAEDIGRVVGTCWNIRNVDVPIRIINSLYKEICIYYVFI